MEALTLNFGYRTQKTHLDLSVFYQSGAQSQRAPSFESAAAAAAVQHG